MYIQLEQLCKCECLDKCEVNERGGMRMVHCACVDTFREQLLVDPSMSPNTYKNFIKMKKGTGVRPLTCHWKNDRSIFARI